MEQQRQRSGVGRILKAKEDAVDVQRCRRCVETLCRELQVGLLLRDSPIEDLTVPQYRALIEILSNQEQNKVVRWRCRS